MRRAAGDRGDPNSRTEYSPRKNPSGNWGYFACKNFLKKIKKTIDKYE